MLIPRFSLRTTLLIVTGCAVFSLVVGQAIQGKSWAIGVTVGGASVVALLLVHACYFAMTVAVSWVTGSEQTPARTSRGGLQLSSDRHAQPNPSTSSEEEVHE